MRKEFAQSIEKYATENEKVIFLTGDLGFMALENLKAAIGKRFINAGVSEQNMMSMAASLAYDGFSPICYSIAPFAVFRPAEQIRVDICLHNLNVKIVGNGGGYGYGIMGGTHHAIEDIAILSPFQNMKCYIPFCNEDVQNTMDAMISYIGPSYLRLGYGIKLESAGLPLFEPIRKISEGNDITIIGMGPVILNAFEALKDTNTSADVFVISQSPLFEINDELRTSILKTKKILIIEEHVRRGGIGENLSLLLMENKLEAELKHLYAKGYPGSLYGSQQYHQEINELSPLAIKNTIFKLL